MWFDTNSFRDGSSWQLERQTCGLSVCRRWRSVAKEIVYSRAIIEFGRDNRYESDYTDFDDDNSAGHTNIDLIIENGAQHMAFQLMIAIHRDDISDIDLAYLADDLLIDESECPRENAIENYGADEWSQPTDDEASDESLRSDDGNDSDESRVRVIARDFSVAVSRRLPHIREIGVEPFGITTAYRRFVDGLFNAYIDQLIYVYCESDDYFPNLQPATRLRSVLIGVSYPYNDGINPFSPGVLRNLQLQSDDFDYTWDDLRADKESCMVQFSNLRTLRIENNYQLYYTARDTFTFGFEFPQLAKLLLRCVRITPNIVECLKNAPLKWVHFEGTPADALLLCSQLPADLEELKVFLDQDFHEMPIGEFVHDAKVLLPHMRAKRLVCVICSCDQFLDISSFDFSHISEFILHADFDPDVLVSKIPSMRNMVDLSIGLEAFDEEKTNSLTSALMSIRQHYTPLTYSKIETVFFGYHDSLNLSDTFFEAIEELHYLLPRLKNLECMSN